MQALKAIRRKFFNIWCVGASWHTPTFECPICCYVGKFCSISPLSGLRRYARCPKCGALERHRLQFLVVDLLLKDLPCTSMKMLHIAPELIFTDYFKRCFGGYETADLYMEGVDHQVDLTALPFSDECYDFVFASHVLEHIQDDMTALGEIRRILRPGGVAVLPVPLVGEETIEYPAPNPAESNHVRAPGFKDYFNRYSAFFKRVEIITSDAFPEKHQLYIYEDRKKYPTLSCPRRQPMSGIRHRDAVPVCYV